MTRRWTPIAAAVVLCLAAPQAAVASPDRAAAARSAPADPLHELEADADGPVQVARDGDGDVAFVGSTDGQAILDSHASTPGGAAKEQLADHGEAFGIDGDTSRAVVTQAIDSSTGGSVVRTAQVVDGVPVFGGQVVLSLDDDQDVVSVAAATTDATQVPAPVVGEQQAEQSAIASTAKGHHVDRGDLTATLVGRRLYDPALLHLADPAGPRPVWQFTVANGSDIRETVLIGTGRGDVALRFDDAPELNRRICDNRERQLVAASSPVPRCAGPVRSEGAADATSADVNWAYENLGATADAYADLAGIDLTTDIGATDASGTKALEATVDWCFKQGTGSDGCPYANAFWDGTQMVFGQGYAAADDVVGHELTHGYVQHTSGLFALHQSGAINESVADVIGEVVDHRNVRPRDTDDDWTIGEDLPPGSPVRNLAHPGQSSTPQPDRMSDYRAARLSDDNGAVHLDDGIGNRTAYLISQGGELDGQAFSGIDEGDAGLTKTGQLYLAVIKRLTSGAQYADLGRTLIATCEEFAGRGTDGFGTADCDTVRDAVTATELLNAPGDQAARTAEAPSTCPTGTRLVNLRRDDDAVRQFGFTANGLWQRTPDHQSPANARSGTSSWFGWDPDPSLDGIATSDLTSSSFRVPAAQAAYLRFDHAYAFEAYDATAKDPRPYYPDGGLVLVQTLSGKTWTTRTLPWTNGPTKPLGRTSTRVFGGDSHGYGSSRLDLSPLAGQTVRVKFRVTGDADTYDYGWWVDDIRAYTCPNTYASVPATRVTAATTSARVAWSSPAYVGSSPVASYRITRSDGRVTTAPASARSVTLSRLRANTNLTIRVAAVTRDGHVGAASAVPVHATTGTLLSAARVKRNRAFTLTVRVVRRGTRSVVAGMPVTLQRHLRGQPWRAFRTGTTNSHGTRSWAVKQKKLTYYRVLTRGSRTWLGSTSSARAVTLR
jgi:Zn-dependent metalloprotease